MTASTAQQLIDLCVAIRTDHKNLSTAAISQLMTAITNLPPSEATKPAAAKIFITLQGTYKVYMRGHLKKLLAKEPNFINTFVAILGCCMNSAMFTNNQHHGFITFLGDILGQVAKEKDIKPSSFSQKEKQKAASKKKMSANDYDDNQTVDIHNVVEAIQKVKIEDLENLASAAESIAVKKQRRPRKARVPKKTVAQVPEIKNAEVNEAAIQI